MLISIEGTPIRPVRKSLLAKLIIISPVGLRSVLSLKVFLNS